MKSLPTEMVTRMNVRWVSECEDEGVNVDIDEVKILLHPPI
jgi:hypothetical protein